MAVLSRIRGACQAVQDYQDPLTESFLPEIHSANVVRNVLTKLSFPSSFILCNNKKNSLRANKSPQGFKDKVFSCIIIFCQTGALCLSPLISQTNLSEIPVQNTSASKPLLTTLSVTVLVGATRLSHLGNHLLTGLSAFTPGLPQVASQCSRWADPGILWKSKMHFF